MDNICLDRHKNDTKKWFQGVYFDSQKKEG